MTLIIAHRGASRVAPENTLCAFEKALEMGAHGIELDVLCSKDGHLVVTHNETLIEFTGVKERVENCNLEELKSLDFGSHFSSQFRGEKLPTLEEVFDLVGNKAWINIEIKGKKILDEGWEKKLLELLQKWGLGEKIVVSSFNIFALKRLQQLAPEIKRGYLYYEKQDPFSKKAGFAGWIQPFSLHPSKELILENTIDEYHQKSYQCWAWTVNEETEMKSLIERKVNALITDVPDLALKVLSSK